MSWDNVKNWIFGGAGAVLVYIFYQFILWQIDVAVDAKFASVGKVTPAEKTAIETRIDNLESLHEKDTARVEGKAERIAEILMEQ